MLTRHYPYLYVTGRIQKKIQDGISYLCLNAFPTHFFDFQLPSILVGGVSSPREISFERLQVSVGWRKRRWMNVGRREYRILSLTIVPRLLRRVDVSFVADTSDKAFILLLLAFWGQRLQGEVKAIIDQFHWSSKVCVLLVALVVVVDSVFAETNKRLAIRSPLCPICK